MIEDLEESALWKAWQDHKRRAAYSSNDAIVFRPLTISPALSVHREEILEAARRGRERIYFPTPEILTITARLFVNILALPNHLVPVLQTLDLDITTTEAAEGCSDIAGTLIQANFEGQISTIPIDQRDVDDVRLLSISDAAITVWLKWLDAEITKSQRSKAHLTKNRSFILHEGQEISQLLSEAIAGADVPDSVRDARDRLDTLLSTLRGANDITEDMTLDIRVQAHGLKRIFDPTAFRRSFSETLGKSSANAIVWGLTMLLLYLLGDAAIDAATDTPSPSTDNIHKA